MTSLRRLTLLFAILTVALGGGATAWLTGAGADTVHAVEQAPPGTQPNGVNFTIHTSLDPSYCVEDTPSAAEPASEATISQCAVRDNQHWTFANADDGAVVIVGGNGDCLDFTGKPVAYVSVVPCDFKADERFYYTPAGLIESTSGKKCLGAAAASQGATIAIVKCDATKAYQIWQLGH
jgi:Ricin-type beta-trefoil lectin domain